MKLSTWSKLLLVSVALLTGLLLGSVVLAHGPTGAATAQLSTASSTAFAYQGELKDGGVAANGPYTMTFQLWDAALDGSAVADTITRTVGVYGGIFTTLIDFGSAPFNGQRRWLAVSVNGTPLGNRQEITPSPYAITAYNGVPAGFMIAGTSPTPPAGYTHSGLRAFAGTAAWRTGGDLATGRAWLAAAALGDKVYAIGGQDVYGGPPLKSVEAYDSSSHRFDGVADLQTGRVMHAAAEAGGRVYAIGGAAGIDGMAFSSVEEYDPGLNTWTYRAPLPTARARLAAASWNGQIYTFGGFSGTTSYSVTEVYSPTANTWTTGTAVPTGGSGLSAATVGDRIYVLSPGALYEYDPVGDSWLRRAEGSGVDSRVVLLANQGNLLALYTMTAVRVYDLATDSWTLTASRFWSRDFIAAATLGNTAYVLGGMSNYMVVKPTEEYTPPPTFYLHQKQ